MNLFALTLLLAVQEAAPLKSQFIDLQRAFSSAPVIYTLLALMSISSLALWLYSLATFRPKDLLPAAFVDELESLLKKKQYREAQTICTERGHLLGSIISAGITTRQRGASIMIDAMKSEGKRVSTSFWQRLALLNDIVIIAPMLGLLGTVIGMFYAFYDVNRSIESINALFDGLGIAVGTTVVGLVVSIIAMIFYSTLKYRIVKTLSLVENRALVLSSLIDPES